MEANPLAALFVERSRDYLGIEYRAKLRKALAALPADKVWWRPNEESNSVGNLLLHLTGNIRQWIVAGVGGTAVTRNRAAEFAARINEELALPGTCAAGYNSIRFDAARALDQNQVAGANFL